ncbi:MAG: hypothetical protein QM742_04510 [Aquabacterium sp.]
MTEDALAGHVHLAALPLAWFGVTAWLAMAWRIWQRWTRDAHALTLQWQGPVERDESSGASSGGFHIAQWRSPVRLKVMLSWQGWMLLRVQRVGDAPARAVHAWLDARDVEVAGTALHSMRNRSLHQLRTLLHLPEGMTTQEGGASGAGSTGRDASHVAMASWAPSIMSGAVLRRLVSLIRPRRVPSGQGHSRIDTAFPVTTVMADRRPFSAAAQPARRPARPHQGGRG